MENCSTSLRRTKTATLSQRTLRRLPTTVVWPSVDHQLLAGDRLWSGGGGGWPAVGNEPPADGEGVVACAEKWLGGHIRVPFKRGVGQGYGMVWWCSGLYERGAARPKPLPEFCRW